MALDPSAPALEFEGRWSTWGELAAAADAVDVVLRDRGLGAGAPVGPDAPQPTGRARHVVGVAARAVPAW